MSNPNTSNNIAQNADRKSVTSAEEPQFDISESSYKTSHTAVRKARRFALQGLYEWLMTNHRFAQNGQGESTQNNPNDIAAYTRANNAMHTVHLGYYHELMSDIPKEIDELEALISPYLDRAIDQIDTVEHAVLLIGTYELKNSLHIPYKVVIDEAMKLNTHFGATDAHKLINAVMDKLAAELRAVEVESDTPHHEKKSQSKKAKQMSAAEAAMLEDNEAQHVADSDNSQTVDEETGQPKVPAKPRIGRKSTKATLAASSVSIKETNESLNTPSVSLEETGDTLEGADNAKDKTSENLEKTDDTVIEDNLEKQDPISDSVEKVAVDAAPAKTADSENSIND